jgi:AcrR family transcriptional regulator
VQTQFDPGVLPNPFKPIVAGGDGVARRQSIQQQRMRRAAILAATRRLLAEGPEQFTLKRVSEECEVTVQTIRNSFGRREECLASALNEHTTAIWQALGSVSSGPRVFLDLAQMYYHCARATPGFLRGMVMAAIANNPPLAALQRHGALIKIEYLCDMARHELLRPGVDIEALAAQITRLNTFMMYEWAIHGDAEELRQQMVTGNRLLLLGAMRARAADEWEHGIPVRARLSAPRR